MLFELLLSLFVFIADIHCSAMITSLQEFKQAITNDHDPVCALVVADWCSICKKIKPYIETVTNNPEIQSQIDFINVSFDAIPELAAEFGITKVPTFCFFNKHGLLVEKIEGIKNIETAHDFLREKITTFLSKTIPAQPHYLKKYIPSKNETQQWIAMYCKTCLMHVRNGIDFLIQKCFN
jgi:thioredoxin-like negative regulator of GroEL